MYNKIIRKIQRILFNERQKFNDFSKILTEKNINSNEEGVSSQKYSNEQIIVSLTSYSKRINDVYLPIESIMCGSIKPNKILLWLGEDMINYQLPSNIQNQLKRGLEVMFTKDIRSYTKLIPSLKKFPNDVIITIDDDVLYPYNAVENLLNAYKKNSNLIYARRMHRIIKKNKILPYRKWEWEIQDDKISTLNFPTGVGGGLYPPKCFDKRVFDENVFMSICKIGDDIWFKAMALLNGVNSQKVDTKKKCKNFGTAGVLENQPINKFGLWNENRAANDTQLKAVFDEYDLWKRLV
jgi:hypothetical protein